jgi:Protein of unknown function (DUF3305)
MSTESFSQAVPEPDTGLVVNPTPDPVPVKVLFQPVDPQASESTWRLSEVLPAWDESETSLQIRLYPDEAEGYYLNITTDAPAIFVHWRSGEVPKALLVTLSYNEAGRLLDGGETVDSVPMPGEMQAWLTEYVNLNYQPEQKKKKGGRNRPSFMKRDEFGRMVDIEKGLGPSANFSEQEPTGAK